jgi:L-2-hydroxyglutarate oxidase LhgO
MDACITVIGAGVVGLAVAEKISSATSSVFVIEKNSSFGQETSSRNSEVIHAGIYYPEGSLKARLCVRGKELLYSFCEKNDVPFRNCGKLIVAVDETERTALDQLASAAERNGVSDLRRIGREEIKKIEPEIFALEALFSPSTGIVDSHSLMKRLETNTVNNGGSIAYGNQVTALRRVKGGYLVTVRNPDGTEYDFTSEKVINCAGLYSDIVAALAGITDADLSIRFCKGEYFRLKPPKNRLISRLVYPVPHHSMEGIGVHVTVDMGGGVKLGPDVTWLNSREQDYRVEEAKKEAFYISAKKYLPFLEPDDIVPEMAGIRPKIQVQGGAARDFYISEESRRGLPGLISLIGIESPGLTSSLAIGEYVAGLIGLI